MNILMSIFLCRHPTDSFLQVSTTICTQHNTETPHYTVLASGRGMEKAEPFTSEFLFEQGGKLHDISSVMGR